MEEVDSILIHTLRQIGCDVNSRISEFSPVQIIKCVTRCLELISPNSEIPQYDGSVSMSGRYKVASEIAASVMDLGYKEEIGCQSFLYPTEEDTRKLLIFMMEKLPKDIECDVGDQLETLLSKIAQENESSAHNSFPTAANGIEVGGIRLPSAVNINNLPKETLRFYASHLAELSFAKEREKFKTKVSELPLLHDKPSSSSSDDDDDFGDPDIPLPLSAEKPELPAKPKPKISKPLVPPKPSPKPPIKEKPDLSNKKDAQDDEAMKLINRINSMQQEAKRKRMQLKSKQKQLNSLNHSLTKLEIEVDKLYQTIEEREKMLQRQRKAKELLRGNEDALEKIRSAVEAQVVKLMNLAQQWEQHRTPLANEIQERISAQQDEELSKAEQIRCLKLRLKEMGHEAKSKEEMHEKLAREYEKMPKDLNRSSYTKRITEIIGNIKKQKKEITNVLRDTKAIQKDINTLSGRLGRTFAVADELIYKDAEKDKNVAQSYKLLVTIHSDFSRLIKVLEEIGNSKRLARDLEDKLDLERGKSIVEKLERLKTDLALMKHENQVLQAKLRGPALIASKRT